jgi:class 3 adenylate cyclase
MSSQQDQHSDINLHNSPRVRLAEVRKAASMAGTFVVSDLIGALDTFVAEELDTPVDVEDCDSFPSEFYIERRCWKRISDCVVVMADLKNSTRLDTKTKQNTTARLYEAATGGLIQVVSEFHPDFVDIQGDGLFAIFHGERRYERAICAGVTVKTFSEKVLVPAVSKRFGERFPSTGFKVGVARGTLLVKRVGVRDTNEPVWAGKPVNWAAAKCAESVDAHELMVTEGVWQKIKDNQYIRYACDCRAKTDLWSMQRNEKLPDDAIDCHVLKTLWCDTCGDAFCRAILQGLTDRGLAKSAA